MNFKHRDASYVIATPKKDNPSAGYLAGVRYAIIGENDTHVLCRNRMTGNAFALPRNECYIGIY